MERILKNPEVQKKKITLKKKIGTKKYIDAEKEKTL
jgi:hypothetical protein